MPKEIELLPVVRRKFQPPELGIGPQKLHSDFAFSLVFFLNAYHAAFLMLDDGAVTHKNSHAWFYLHRQRNQGSVRVHNKRCRIFSDRGVAWRCPAHLNSQTQQHALAAPHIDSAGYLVVHERYFLLGISS